jgi:hypothetical protein
MTAAEWLDCADPDQMLQSLGDTSSDRIHRASVAPFIGTFSRHSWAQLLQRYFVSKHSGSPFSESASIFFRPRKA